MMTLLLVATRKSNCTFTEGIFSWQEKGVKLSTLVHSWLAMAQKIVLDQSFQQFFARVQTRLKNY